MEMTLTEEGLLEARLELYAAKVQRFLRDKRYSLKERLIVYLATPASCYKSHGTIPNFPQFRDEYGEIEWQIDFPYLKRDQCVNLVRFCNAAVGNRKELFPRAWTDDMIFLFVKDCVDSGIHEFDFYW
jgi:hypothetical protein